MPRSAVGKTEENSFFDLSKLPPEEVKSIFQELTPRALQRWLDYYVGKEKYEICTIIRQVMRDKGMM